MKKLFFLSVIVFLGSCRNRDINEGEKFRPRELHDNFNGSHFTKINIDGIDYILLERDNNNPHEGFGFMAFRANRLMEKQDSILAYMQTISKFQTKMYAKAFDMPEEEAALQYEESMQYYLGQYNFEDLQKENLTDHE